MIEAQPIRVTYGEGIQRNKWKVWLPKQHLGINVGWAMEEYSYRLLDLSRGAIGVKLNSFIEFKIASDRDAIFICLKELLRWEKIY